MYRSSLEIVMDEPMRRRLRTTGILLVVIGILGVIVPKLIGVTLSLLIAGLLLFAGALVGYNTWYSYNRSALAWLKPFLLVTVGLLVAFYPTAGTAAIGLVLITFFLLDGFASISFSLSLRPMPGWVWTLISGIASLVLAVIFIAGWPFSSIWLVGLLVGIGLLFNGIALLMLARAAQS